MDEVTARAEFLESAPEAEAGGITATVSRTEIEEALRGGDGQPELVLDVVRGGRDGDPDAERRTVAVAWERNDVERLLQIAPTDTVTFAIDRGSLERALSAPDVEGHGLRERALVLTVAAATAAGAGASIAQAKVEPGEAGGGQSIASAYTAFEAASAQPAAPADAYSAIEAQRAQPAAPANDPYTAIEAARAQPGAPADPYASIEAARATPSAGATDDYAAIEAARAAPKPASLGATAAGGGGTSFSAPEPGTAAGVGAALAIAITGAAFLVRGRRRTELA